jgi:hypothetical protein
MMMANPELERVAL